jgi:hypothetical protein
MGKIACIGILHGGMENRGDIVTLLEDVQNVQLFELHIWVGISYQAFDNVFHNCEFAPVNLAFAILSIVLGVENGSRDELTRYL